MAGTNTQFKGRGLIQITGRQMGMLYEYSQLEQDILNKAGTEMAREIDREVLWGMLEGLGWHRVMLPRLIDNHHAIDITYWLETNCKHPFERSGRDFLFESQKDANWFKLRWGTE